MEEIYNLKFICVRLKEQYKKTNVAPNFLDPWLLKFSEELLKVVKIRLPKVERYEYQLLFDGRFRVTFYDRPNSDYCYLTTFDLNDSLDELCKNCDSEHPDNFIQVSLRDT